VSGPEFIEDAMLTAIPRLRAFAVLLSGNEDQADDLVHETLQRAVTGIHFLNPGTDIRAWLFMILRNQFHSRSHAARTVRGSIDDQVALTASSRTAITPAAHGKLRQALIMLPPQQREALILVVASGFSYEQAAQICGCPVGTIKSRVNRARLDLARLMAVDDSSAFDQGRNINAATARRGRVGTRV
jgi:RNA polymerase sigma-70 factor (ECF subfamily)